MMEFRVGRKINKLLILKKIEGSQYECLCDCGNITKGDWKHIRKGNKKSCGCLRGMVKEAAFRNHSRLGVCKHELYQTWRGMIRRCLDIKHHAYKTYGALGITVCKAWQENFFAFADYVGQKPNEGYSIDRINNEGNYEPNNVRWATPQEQADNSRNGFKVVFNNVIIATPTVCRKYTLSELAVKKARAQGFKPAEAIAIAYGRKKLSEIQATGKKVDWNLAIKNVAIVMLALKISDI